MKKYLGLILFLSTVITFNVEAASASNKTVDKIYTGYTHKGVFFTITSDDNNNANSCSAGVPRTYFVDPNHSDVGQVLSVLLAAQLSDRVIDIEIYDDKCAQNHRVIRKIALN